MKAADLSFSENSKFHVPLQSSVCTNKYSCLVNRATWASSTFAILSMSTESHCSAKESRPATDQDSLSGETWRRVARPSFNCQYGSASAWQELLRSADAGANARLVGEGNRGLPSPRHYILCRCNALCTTHSCMAALIIVSLSAVVMTSSRHDLMAVGEMNGWTRSPKSTKQAKVTAPWPIILARR